MVAVPTIQTQRVDGGLSAIVDSSAGRFAVAGPSSIGPFVPTLITSLATLRSTFGAGPLVDDASYVLSLTGRVLCQRIETTSSGAKGAVLYSGAGSPADALTAGGGNTSTAVPSLTGVPTVPVQVALRITVAASNLAAATARYQYSLDGGLTWSAALTPSASEVDLGTTGVTISWADGSFVVSDTFAGYSVPGARVGTATLAITGNPADAYDARVEILRAGATLAAGTATYRLSLDGGDTWGPETALPVSGAIQPAGTGLTLTWTYSSGTGFAVGDLYTFRTSAPTYDATTMAAAYEALDTGDDDFEAILWSGAFTAALCTSLDALCETSAEALRYRICFVGLRDLNSGETIAAWETSIKTDFATWVGVNVVVCAGHVEVLSAATQRYNRRSSAVVVAGRAASVPISEDLAWVERGPLPGVTAIYYDGADNPGLNDFGFTTLRKRRSRTIRGFYVVNPHTGALSTSDFKLLQYLRAWNEAARVLADAMTPHSSRRLRTVPKPLPVPTPPVYEGKTAGSIDEREARAIEAGVNAKLSAALLEGPVAHVTSVAMSIDRTVDITSTRTLSTSLSLGPMGYAKVISNRIGFALGGA
jgi:Protein of unknown function (DUF2586)